MTVSCTVSGVDGVDGGNLNLNGFTLTINPGATFALNPGFSLTVNGTIAVGAGGQLRQTRLWYIDSDNDNFISSLTQIAQETAPAGGKPRNTFTSAVLDCYDNNSNANPGQTGFFATNRGDGSFDYNCDGSITMQYPTGGNIIGGGTHVVPACGETGWLQDSGVWWSWGTLTTQACR